VGEREREKQQTKHTLQWGQICLTTSKTHSTAVLRAACSSGVGDRKLQKSTISVISNINQQVT
jgi:hypothetical protein